MSDIIKSFNRLLAQIRQGNVGAVRDYLADDRLLMISGHKQKAVDAACEAVLNGSNIEYQSQFLAILELLQGAGCNIDIYSATSWFFEQAVRLGDLSFANFLLTHNSCEGDLKRYLLDRLDRADYCSAFRIISYKTTALNFLLENDKEDNALLSHILLDQNYKGDSAEAVAQKSAVIEIVNLLVTSGAKLDQESGVIEVYINNLIDYFLLNTKLLLPSIDFSNQEMLEKIFSAFKNKTFKDGVADYSAVIARISSVQFSEHLEPLIELLRDSEKALDAFESVIRGREENISIMPKLMIHDDESSYYSLESEETKKYYIEHPDEEVVGRYLQKTKDEFVSRLNDLLKSDHNISDKVEYCRVIKDEFSSICNVILPYGMREFIDEISEISSEFITNNPVQIYDDPLTITAELYDAGLLGEEDQSS